MQEQRLSIPSYSRSHQLLKPHPQEINSRSLSRHTESLSRHTGEVSHLNNACIWQTVETNRQQIPIFSACLTEVLSAIFHYQQQEPQKVSELLVENLDIIQNLPNELRRLTTKLASTLTKNQSVTLAWVLADLGGLIWQFPNGQKAFNRDVAIACCETALYLLESHKFSQVWVKIHNNLALAYAERLIGDRTTNLLQAFTHYRQAAHVVGRQPFPQHWMNIKI